MSFLFSLAFGASAWALPAISGDANMNEFASSAFQLYDNRICSVFEDVKSFDNGMEAKLYSTCVKDRKFQKPRMLQPALSAEFTYLANGKPLWFKGKQWIYFNAYNEATKVARIGRFAFDENNPSTPVQWIDVPENLTGQSSVWSYPLVLESGKVLLSYRFKNPVTGSSELKFAVSDDGLKFMNSKTFTEGAQLVRSSQFVMGPWAWSFQVGSGKNMQAYVVLSDDEGKTFSERIQITQRENIHDTYLLPRLDGDLDVYYLVWFDGKGFSLFRRKLSRDGKLGEEQQLTSTAVSVEKPHALRLNTSNSIFLTLTQWKATATSLATDVVFMTLMDDAL